VPRATLAREERPSGYAIGKAAKLQVAGGKKKQRPENFLAVLSNSGLAARRYILKAGYPPTKKPLQEKKSCHSMSFLVTFPTTSTHPP
jgi:hypothetical protein